MRVIGRVVVANPAEGDRYYLRLILNHVRAPTSFCYLKTFAGVKAPTFCDAALLHGLLEADNCHELCLSKAAMYQMPCSLRRLFATILVYCNPNNPGHLWNKFEVAMSEDFTKDSALSMTNVRYKTLSSINDVLESMGKQISQFEFCSPDWNSNVRSHICKEIADEINVPILDADCTNVSLLNIDQRHAYDIILGTVLTNNSKQFFIDGPGGTGKTFLYRYILASVRAKGFIALTTASSGVAASILPGGRTAHSRFKIPIDIETNLCCNISKQSGLADLLRKAKLIIWDEASMARRQSIEALDMMLQDVTEINLPFGGKVVVFGGDFRQMLPVLPKSTREETIAATLVMSPLWPLLQKLKLVENMRARHDPLFSEYLLRIGNDTEPSLPGGEISIPHCMLMNLSNTISSLNCLINAIVPDLNEYCSNAFSMVNRAILTPKNEDVDYINELLIGTFPGQGFTYTSIDQTVDSNEQGQYEDFLNSLSPSGLPPHKLTLKKNCPIMLMRNIDPPQGLCNGTRLICRDFQKNVICAEIAIGDHKGNFVFLPRIPLQPSDKHKFPVQFTRRQFPVRLCFAMTINKAQGQTLKNVGIYLPQPVFSHGQLYVALSRATTAAAVKLYIESKIDSNSPTHYTKNVVYREVLMLSQCS